MRARPKEATGRLAKFINYLHTLALATGSAARFDPSSALPGPQHFRISGASAQTRPERFSLARVLERKRSTGGLARRRGRAAFPSPLHALPSQAGAFHHRDWADPLALHNPRADWRRWNGSSLSRPRRTPSRCWDGLASPGPALPLETVFARFRGEALALAKLNHPNIETVFDYGAENGVDF